MTLKQVGPFSIIAPLGQGGMGTVWRARQQPFGRIVALKVLRSANLGDSDSERRFAREVELAAALSHPHLVKVLDGGIIDDMSYIAMELVEGDTFLRVIENCHVLPWTHAAALTSRLAAALAYLHDQNILHRDVKPANTLLSFDGWVKLMDFGLAKWKEATVMTADGAVVGTLQFLPPEVLHGGGASVAADLWPVGCMLYRMLCGRAHIEASTQSGWLQQLSESVIAPVQDLAPEVPPPLAELIMQLLARDPAKRPKSAAEVEERLDDLLTELEDTTWDQVLTPEQAQVMLGRTPPEPDEKSAPAAVSEEPSAVTQRLPTRPPSGPSNPRPGSSTAATPRSGGMSTPRRVPSSPRNSGALKPPQGLRTPTSVTVRPSSGHISIAMVAPAPPSRRRAGVAVGAALVLLVLGFKLMRPAPPPPPVPSPSASAEAAPSPSLATEVTGVSAERSRSSLTGRGLMLERYLARLKSGGKGAQRALEELKPLTPLSLGNKACAYINWIQLEQWIADSRRAASPPRSPCAQAGPMEILTEKMYLNVLLRARIERADSAITSLALEHVADYPDDGRTWLTLGRLLDLDGRPEAAALIYGIALERLEGVSVVHKGELLGAAMARAMTTVPGRNLERDIWSYLTEGKEARRALRGIGVGLGLEGRDRYEAFLRSGLTRPVIGEICAWVLAEFLEEVRLKPGLARRLIREYLVANGRADLATDYLISHLCNRGLIEEADRTVVTGGGNRRYAPYFDYLRGAAPSEMKTAGKIPSRERFTRWEAFSRMERGDWARARNEAEALKAFSHDTLDLPRLVYLDLAGRPGADKVVLDGARDHLIRDPATADWVEASGALATPEGRPVMERMLAALPATVELKPYFHALWLARCGQLDQALDANDEANREVRAAKIAIPDPPIDLADITCRPLIEAAAGVAVPPAVLDRARAGTVPSQARALHQALASDDTAAARKAAWHLFELFPQQPFPLIAVAWLEAGTGSVTEWPGVRKRLLGALRARAYGLWIRDEIEQANRIAVARGAARPSPAPSAK